MYHKPNIRFCHRLCINFGNRFMQLKCPSLSFLSLDKCGNIWLYPKGKGLRRVARTLGVCKAFLIVRSRHNMLTLIQLPTRRLRRAIAGLCYLLFTRNAGGSMAPIQLPGNQEPNPRSTVLHASLYGIN